MAVSDERYTVSNSQDVAHQLRAAVDAARAHGQFAMVVRAARWILDELERNPAAFGESRNYLDAAQLHVRIGFAGQMYVVYGVHEPSRTVFVRKLGYSARRT